jgi:superoxide reductase
METIVIAPQRSRRSQRPCKGIQLYFKPEDDKFTYQVGNYEFSAHGESVGGADQGPVYTNHSATARLKIRKPGTLYATALCNIHGLWENSKTVKVS